MNYYLAVLKKYAVFDGRARRAEYWYFFLFNMIIGFVLGLTEGLLGIAPESEESVLANIYSLAILIPSIAVGIRRMHDVNKSGWYLLFPFYNLLLLIRDGTNGDNRYGPDPKESGDAGSLAGDNASFLPTEESGEQSGERPHSYCSACGAGLSAEENFCHKCGAKKREAQ